MCYFVGAKTLASVLDVNESLRRQALSLVFRIKFTN
jgi:hypothetical protein